MLFPLRPRIKGRQTVGDAVSKWLHRYAEDVGVRGKKPLHSFRHYVVTKLEDLGVPQNKIMQLVGHTDSSITGRVYTDRSALRLGPLKEYLEKLT